MWEYRHILAEYSLLPESVKLAGLEGWELIQVTEDKEWFSFYLKRRILKCDQC